MLRLYFTIFCIGSIQTEGSELIALRWQPNTGVGSEVPRAILICRLAGKLKSSPSPTALAGLSWPHESEAMWDKE